MFIFIFNELKDSLQSNLVPWKDEKVNSPTDYHTLHREALCKVMSYVDIENTARTESMTLHDVDQGHKDKAKAGKNGSTSG